jgi:hypothetical protein
LGPSIWGQSYAIEELTDVKPVRQDAVTTTISLIRRPIVSVRRGLAGPWMGMMHAVELRFIVR